MTLCILYFTKNTKKRHQEHNIKGVIFKYIKIFI